MALLFELILSKNVGRNEMSLRNEALTGHQIEMSLQIGGILSWTGERIELE